MKPIKSAEAFFSIGEDKIRTIVSLYSDGIVSLTQDDGHKVYLYPGELKAIQELLAHEKD